MPQRVGDQSGLLGRMALGQPGRRRSRCLAPGIARPHALEARLGQAGFEQILDELPCAIVLRFFLRPDELGQLGHRFQPLDQRLGRERIKLLDPHDFGVLVARLVACFHQLIGELARAQHQPLGRALGGPVEVVQNSAEMAVAGEVGLGRDRELVPQQRLGRHHDQGLAEIAQQLPPQDVEIIGRRGAVGDLDIVLGAELQIALEPRRAMLRPLPFVAVRQQHHEPAGAQPLGLARRDELVDDDLRAVAEIAELRLPQHERARVGDRIAIFEAEHAEFGERAVAHLEIAGR